jgi:hypothetical protein
LRSRRSLSAIAARTVPVAAYTRMSVNSLTVYFHWMYKQAGFEGASSHSGRRTFGTQLARRANKYHNSLKDVQTPDGSRSSGHDGELSGTVR